MKKILVSLMAVAMVLSMAACAKKCPTCEKKIDGDGFKYDGKTYCNELCALADELT